MNLVQQIMDQLSGDAFGRLGSLLGTDADTTERATTAAVPSLLSALASMMSNDDSAKKLTGVLGGLDTSALGDITQMLGSDSGALLNRGTSMLGSLFNNTIVSGISSAVSRYTGLNPTVVKSLLAYLLPLVLGKVGAQWKNQGGTPHGLSSLFADQRNNIASALPAGFSLADMPGLSDTRQPAHRSSRTEEVEPAVASSSASWVLPLALVLLGGFLLWQFMSRPAADRAAVEKPAGTADEVIAMKPVLPELIDAPNLARVRDDLGGLFKSLDTAFSDIHDAASAQIAMSALKDLNSKIDAMNTMLSHLPEASAATLRPLIEEQLKMAEDKARAANSVEGVGADIKALIQEIMAKIKQWVSAEN